ncbi:hypothetical protein FA013_30280 [Raoultella planticola]|nr:hypothetical protein FA013_30280 [Raoultella planticola]
MARHVRIAAITTTKRALPVSESNGPFPCPSPDIELSWRLGSNQTLCLARQCPHRCVPVFPGCHRASSACHAGPSTSGCHCRRECWHLTDLITPRINWSGCYRYQSATVQDI